MTIRVSVVVPTYRRPDLLGRCLAALVTQDFDPTTYEILVADDAACEATRSLVNRWASHAAVAIRYLSVSGTHGPAAARNVGWRAAQGEIIAFTDDDCVPDPGWLSGGTAAFFDGVLGAWGRVVVPLTPQVTDYHRDAAKLERAEFVTANCFYRREALIAVGGFDERFTTAWREDSDLFFTLLERGGRLVQAPKALVVHPVRPARWGVSLKQQRKNMFNALLYKKHPELYRRRIQAAPPWHYYATLAALLAMVAGLAGGSTPVAVTAGVGWGLLTGRFCQQRLTGTTFAPQHVAEMIATSVFIPPLAVFWRLVGAVRFRVLFL
ncbi:MAG: glycosyltransferase [Thermoguttaceae bacterium]|jgi:glycosyltransferase involved in cell wall biosynthesis